MKGYCVSVVCPHTIHNAPAGLRMRMRTNFAYVTAADWRAPGQ